MFGEREYGEPDTCEKCGGPRGRQRDGRCVYDLHGNWICKEDYDADAAMEARRDDARS